MKYTFKGNFGLMNLTIKDSQAEGTYQKNGSLKGIFKNNTFTGSWENKGMEGLAEFTISDGTLEGNWKKGTAPGPLRSKWKGEEVSNKKDVSEPASPSSDAAITADSLLFVGLKEKIEQLYEAEDYAKVISTFEQNEALLETDQNIVHRYLFSMWFYGDLEEETILKVWEFEAKFENTERWNKLKGWYFCAKERYDTALLCFESSSELHYKQTKKIFDDFEDLYDGEQYLKAINYFESALRHSISKHTFYIAEKYCWALHENSETKENALSEVRRFIELHSDHIPFQTIEGKILSINGYLDDNLDLLKEAADIFSKLKDKQNLQRTKERIEYVKNLLKENTEEEKRQKGEQKEANRLAREQEKAAKQAEKEVAKSAKLSQHKIKSSRGILFCQYCGEEQKYCTGECHHRKNGHNFVYLKVDGAWEITCNLCGSHTRYKDFKCS